MATGIFARILALALWIPSGAALAASYSESVSGDLSGNRLAPTAFALDSGVNTLSGSTQGGDLDYVTIFAPAPIVALSLVSYVSTNDISVIAIQAGQTFTEPNTGTDPANLLGWSHFGPGSAGSVGADLLALLGSAVPAIGFTGSLPAGYYTLWIQQTTAGAATAYDFDITVPEPGAWLLMGLASTALFALRRRA
jgi:hypothetical protein